MTSGCQVRWLSSAQRHSAPLTCLVVDGPESKDCLCCSATPQVLVSAAPVGSVSSSQNSSWLPARLGALARWPPERSSDNSPVVEMGKRPRKEDKANQELTAWQDWGRTGSAVKGAADSEQYQRGRTRRFTSPRRRSKGRSWLHRTQCECVNGARPAKRMLVPGIQQVTSERSRRLVKRREEGCEATLRGLIQVLCKSSPTVQRGPEPRSRPAEHSDVLILHAKQPLLVNCDGAHPACPACQLGGTLRLQPRGNEHRRWTEKILQRAGFRLMPTANPTCLCRSCGMWICS